MFLLACIELMLWDFRDLCSMLWVMNLYGAYCLDYLMYDMWLCWYHIEGEPSSCLVSMVSYSGGARSLIILDYWAPQQIRSITIFLCVCIYVVINYQKGGDWKCNHDLNHIFLLVTTCMLGLIMFIKYISGLCLKGRVWIMTRDKCI